MNRQSSETEKLKTLPTEITTSKKSPQNLESTDPGFHVLTLSVLHNAGVKGTRGVEQMFVQ